MKDGFQNKCCQSRHEGAPIVRNSRGVESAFSVDRFSAVQVAHGLALEEAWRLARELLVDLNRAGLGEVTTDDIRHWLQERDPHILAARRTQDSRLAELAEFCELAGGPSGPLLHQLLVDHFRPGPDGLIFQQKDEDDKKEEIPPWPEEGKDDPLEKPFGADADRIKMLTLRELKELRRAKLNDDIGHLGSKPKDAGFTKSGDDGDPVDITDSGWKSSSLYSFSDGRFRRTCSKTFASCGEVWILDLSYFKNVPKCAGLNWAAAYRATLLRAHAEAFRLCRKNDPKCPDARLWLLRRGWNCFSKGPPPNRQPVQQVWMQLAVVCIAG